MKTILIALLIVFVTVATGIFGLAMIVAPDNDVSVRGSSNYEVDPDLITIHFEVRTNATTTTAAQAENAILIERVIKNLQAAGVKDENLQTINYRMGPRTYYDYKNHKQVEDGQEVYHYVQVKVEDTLHSGNYIDIAIKSGATRVSHVQTGLSPEKLIEAKRKATELAARDARAKAEGMAEGLGMKLGKVLSVSDTNHNYRPYMRTFAEATSVMEAKSAVADTIISPGVLNIGGSVHVRFALA